MFVYWHSIYSEVDRCDSSLEKDEIQSSCTSWQWIIHLWHPFLRLAHWSTRSWENGHTRRSRKLNHRQRSSWGAWNFVIHPRHLCDRLLKSIQNKRVLALNLASVMAGTGIGGQFEEKFKALIKDIEEEVRFFALFVSLRPYWFYHTSQGTLYVL